MYVTKIRMQNGCNYSNNLLEIDSLYIEDDSELGFYKKEVIYNFLKENPGTIKVKRYPYPDVIPAESIKGEKYVRSYPNSYLYDNLLDLPRV